MNQTAILLNKVIKGLKAHMGLEAHATTGSWCMKNCPYWRTETSCSRELAIDALALLKSLSAFKSYFDNLYGEGLEVANYHLNDETEEFDNFYADAMWEYETLKRINGQ